MCVIIDTRSSVLLYICFQSFMDLVGLYVTYQIGYRGLGIFMEGEWFVK